MTNKKTPTSTNRRVDLQITAVPGSQVYVAGTFNNWAVDAQPMKDKGGTGRYTVRLTLAPGVHEYKFVVNGEWHVDPSCTNWVQNSFGTLNSVLEVR